MDAASFISGIMLEKAQNSVKQNQPLTLSLEFKVEGNVRDVFTQKNWERAYNKHDNVFRLNFEVKIKSGRKTVLPIKFVRKAALFWTRNPKIPYRIWVSVVNDGGPFYPLKEEEARSALFDVRRAIELEASHIDSDTRRLTAEITVSWGKHDYIEPAKITGKSNEIEILRVASQ